MSDATGLLALMWVSLTLYVLLAGADFGAGVLDLLAGSPRGGAHRRALIEHVIGPVWEANHVWLIFVLVLLWTCFPPVFAAIASTLYVPLTLVALGIIGRGAAFAFRKAVTTARQQRLFGATFAASSVLTPFFLGASAGAIGSDRVPTGIAQGRVLGSWITPTSMVTGALAVVLCAFLAATYLTGDATRSAPELTEYFRRQALVFGAAAGLLSVGGLVVVSRDAHALAQGLGDRALPLVVVAVAAGTTSLVLVFARRYLPARISAGLAVTGLLWAWGVARYPQLLPGLDTRAAAALPATLRATVWAVLAGLVLLVPSMLLLLRLFQRGADTTRREAS